MAQRFGQHAVDPERAHFAQHPLAVAVDRGWGLGQHFGGATCSGGEGLNRAGRRLRIVRGARWGIGGAYSLIKLGGLTIGRSTELAHQDAATALVLRQSRGALATGGIGAHQAAVCGLVPRLQCQQLAGALLRCRGVAV